MNLKTGGKKKIQNSPVVFTKGFFTLNKDESPSSKGKSSSITRSSVLTGWCHHPQVLGLVLRVKHF